ncbi:MAG: Hsp33 family molecular chaperone [Pseudomonadota bacterium]|nr:Hsp33 family molecular chaperone [Pseudomonadota bacterium]
MAEQKLRPAGDDAILPFQVGDSAVRGRIVRLGPAIDEILRVHPFPANVRELIGEAATLVALMGSALKFDGKLIFQAQGDGPASMLVADYSASGALRAMAKLSGEAPDGAKGLEALLGAGHIALTIDQGPDMERYQGVTPIEGDSLARAAISYFDQSEQIPTAVKLAVGRVYRPGEGETWRAGGVIVQFMPGEGGGRERGEAVLKAPEDRDLWERAAVLLETTQADELLDPDLSAETLLYRLYHEDGVRVFEPKPVRAECSCSADKIAAVLERYGPDELGDMVEDGFIRAACEFCRTEYLFDREGKRAAS